jgi:excinuclease ABC subunit C
MISRACTVDWIVTPNDIEALLLEDILIKKHRPAFNVRFRDDKRYPVLRLSVQEDFPVLTKVRRFEQDGALYFGPYTSGRTLRAVLRAIEKYFPLRKCQGTIHRQDRGCLNYQMKTCPGICRGHVSKEEYRHTVNHVQLLLSGRSDELIHQLEQEMAAFSERLNFEAAAICRDQLEGVRNISGGRKLLFPRPVDIDVFAFDCTDTEGYAEILFIRSGMLSGNAHMCLKLDQPEPLERIAEHLMIHHYRRQPPIPRVVITNRLPAGHKTIESYLKTLSGRAVRIVSRQRGVQARLIRLAASNLKLHKNTDRPEQPVPDSIRKLQLFLNLEHPPVRIEAIDISESQGKHIVGSIVSFFNGRPEKSHYRRYKLAVEPAQSDPDRIRQVLHRRFTGPDGSPRPPPDLFLIDGGRLQLDAALIELADLNLSSLPVISLVKARNNRQKEGVFLKDGTEIVLNPADPAVRYLDQIRDEAHRFAITYHRLLRDRAMLRSTLAGIPGVGPVSRKALLKHFGSLDAIKAASVEAIAAVPGFGIRRAKKLKTSFSELDERI